LKDVYKKLATYIIDVQIKKVPRNNEGLELSEF